MVTQPAEEVRPSERARVLVRGAYDLHVHIAPTCRRGGSTTCRSPAASPSSVSRASRSSRTTRRRPSGLRSSRRSSPTSRWSGRSTLNQAVGGMNALAVEIAAREGARIVWMPTVDSPAETAGRTEPKPGDKVPQWARLQHELRGLGLGVEPVHVTGEDGQLLPETRDVLRAIARHGLDPRHRASRPGRHVRRRRRRARGRCRAHRRHAPGVPLPELLDRGPGRARGARLPARALPEHAAQRQDDLGARLRGRPRGRRRAHRSSRATSATPTTRRSRTGSRSGPTACSSAGFDEDEVRELIVGAVATAGRSMSSRSCSSSAPIPPTSSGGRAARSPSRRPAAARRACSRSRTASAASPASSGRSRTRRSSA